MIAGFLIVLMGFAGLATGIAAMITQIPSVTELLAARPHGATQIFDRYGKVVASIQNGENRDIVPLTAIALPLQEAVIASEDIRFYEHHGLDVRGLLRALYTRGERGGGSTLTQQLAKNLFLNSDRTLNRKVADMWLALQLERTLDKNKILEMYLNQVYFGHGAYGVEAASRKYFGKHAKAINASEAAMLAGLLPAPEYYSPYRNPTYAKEVQRLVLGRMVDAGYLGADEAAKAGKRRLVYANTPDYAYRAPYFTSYVLSLMQERFGTDLVMRGALKIHTTLDLAMQEEAEAVIKSGVASYRRLHVGQGALVAVEPGTGAVRALVGGTAYDKSPFNRATQAFRQPGSTFKPFVYLTAFTQGYGPASIVLDSPISFGRYAPQNYDHRTRGAVSIERAVAFSYNIPAVRIANAVGIGNVIKLAHDVGIRSPLPENLAVALGSAEVTPLELASAYATFGADGIYAEPQLITRVEDANGVVIEQLPVVSRPAVVNASVWALNRCLTGVVTYGTGAAANIGRPAAGKTGTTSENRDTWFAGYTPDLACVIWLGNDDNSRLASSATGGGLAAPLWARFMRAAHRKLPIRELKTAGGSGTVSPSPADSPLPEQEATPIEEMPSSIDPDATPSLAPGETPNPEGTELVEPLPSPNATNPPPTPDAGTPATAAPTTVTPVPITTPTIGAERPDVGTQDAQASPDQIGNERRP